MEIFHHHSLAPYTTVKIGGPADTFITTDTTEEFLEVLTKYSSSSLTVLGNGSNVLISDSGIRGIVVKNLSANLSYLPDNKIKVDSGVQLSSLINDSIKHSLTGLEEFAYIPSTIGGAIYGNIHGTNKNNFDKFVDTIEVFDLESKAIKSYTSTNLKWSYDSSEFQSHPHWIIVSAVIKLQPGNSSISKKIVTDIIAQKSLTQSLNSLGSVFKNPPNDFAGRIIDQELGLKGFRFNDVQISPKHTNFILNLGHGTASDYLAVINKIQTYAKSKGFHLEPEIKFLGQF